MSGKIDKRQTDTRERLFLIALDLFSKNGVDGTSIRDIVGRAGISTAAFYNHFASKDDLLQEIYRHYMSIRTESLDDVFGDLDSTLSKAGPAGLVEALAARSRVSMEDPVLEKLSRIIVMEQYRNPAAAEIVRADKAALIALMEGLFAAIQEKGYLSGRDARLVGRMAAYLLLGIFGDNEYSRFIKGESVDLIIERQGAMIRDFIEELSGGRS